MSRQQHNLTKVFGIPALIFILTLTGLISTLLTDGKYDLFGALISGSALLVILCVLLNPKPGNPAPKS